MLCWHFTKDRLPQSGIDVIAVIGDDFFKLRYLECLNVKGWFRFDEVQEDEFFAHETEDVERWTYVLTNENASNHE